MRLLLIFATALLLASPVKAFTYAAWNIGHFALGVKPYSLIADKDVPAMLEQYRKFLSEVNADVVGLAEYSHFMDASGKLGVPTTLFEGWRYVNEGPFRNQGHWNAQFVKKFRVLSTGSEYYRDFFQPCNFVYSRLELGGTNVVLVMTHFEPNYPCDQKAKRASQIRQVINTFQNDKYVVIAGDFNVKTQDELQPFIDAGYVLGNDGSVMTWPANKPKVAIDQIAAKGLTLKNFRCFTAPKLSDHCLVSAELDFISPLGKTTDVVIETSALKLTIAPDATAKSLICKANGEECLDVHEKIPMFATTQIRPFNNEIRLVQQAKRTTYPANRIRREGDKLFIGFETAPYEVVVKVIESADGYVAFKVDKLISNTTDEHQYYHWKMDVPPVDSFRLLQLPVKNRKDFGDWLNVMADKKAIVGVMGGTPYMDVDNEKRHGFRKLTVESLKDFGVTNGIAVLSVAPNRENFLNQVDAMERDFKLPRGVQSRRDSRLNASLFWLYSLKPDQVEECIKYMKLGGFRMLLLYHPALIKAKNYSTLPDYTLDNGWTEAKLTEAMKRFHKEGISVGIHTLQTFIGMKSKYVTPEADHRLYLSKRFTLAQDLPANDKPCEILVEENPIAAPMEEHIRVLKFGTEIFNYTGYTTTKPYKFTGVTRHKIKTGIEFESTVKTHTKGEIGGVLAMSECQAISCYIDQNTSLQDEVAEKIAKIYKCDFDFLYFDGSEDANPPCTINISLSQLKCVEACARAAGKYPLFTEGCAKSHFGWHIQSGANAFDVFPPEYFKEKIIEYPYAAAKRLAKDFTRVDFGWWRYGMPKPEGKVYTEGLWRGDMRTVGVQADIWEYGTSKAAAFDCPSTMQIGFINKITQHPRYKDIFETIRRWEDVRAKRWLTPAQKELLKDSKKEFHLYLNERGEYELIEWKQLDVAGGKWTNVRAFLFERQGKRVVAYWHISDKGLLKLGNGLGGLKAENLTYWESDLDEAALRLAFVNATISAP